MSKSSEEESVPMSSVNGNKIGQNQMSKSYLQSLTEAASMKTSQDHVIAALRGVLAFG